jgi:DNA cross-link repair 1A protein
VSYTATQPTGDLAKLPLRAQNILHTGDMRWHARMGQHPALRTRRIDLLFLDTTYASPQHVFPSQARGSRFSSNLLGLLR